MGAHEPVNILLVDDKPAKLLSYEAILSELGETLINAGSAKEALKHMLKREIAVVLTDVRMPELDGFELAAMIREHPRFESTAIIFISACQLEDVDRLRGYKSGAVDYVTAPFVPDLLRAKVKVFAELYRKTRQLEQLNAELERRVAKRTAALTASMERLRENEGQFRAVFNQQFQFMTLLSADGRLMEVNDLAMRATGVPREAVLGQLFWETPWWDGLPEMRAAWPGRLEAAARADGPVVSEDQFLAHGEVRTAECTLTAVKAGDGQVKFFIFEASDITERRRAEDARRKSEALASAVLASALDAVIMVDHRGMVVEWNRAAEHVFGYSRTDAVGREMAELVIPPRLREAHRRGLEHYSVRGAGPALGRLIEFPALRASGAEFPVELYIAPIPIEGPPRFTGFVRDITQRKADEAALKESEERLRVAAEAANFGIYDRNLRTGALYISHQLKSILGYAPDAPLAHGQVMGHFHPADRAPGLEAFQRACDPTGDGHLRLEQRIVRPDGEVRWIAVEGQVLFLDGAAERSLGLWVDITERKRAEQALVESRQQLQFVADHAPVLIAQCDAEGRYKFVNRPYADFFGCRPADIVGRHPRQMLGEAAYAHAAPYIEKALAGHPCEYDLELPDTAHGPRVVRVAYAPELDASGRLAGWVAAVLDITERKRAEDHLRSVMTELSHRTKNLMAVVQAISWQTAQKSVDFGDFEQRFTQRLEALARSHDLLVKRGWQGVVLEDLVRAHLEPFLDRAKERLTAHGHALLLTPEAAQDLGLALHELATNASKYGALSVPAGQIDVGWTIDGDGTAGAKRFHMTWRESGGPTVSPPVHKGFGTTLMTSTLSKSFTGETKLEYSPAGLSWELAAPVGHLITELR